MTSAPGATISFSEAVVEMAMHFSYSGLAVQPGSSKRRPCESTISVNWRSTSWTISPAALPSDYKGAVKCQRDKCGGADCEAFPDGRGRVARSV